MTNTATIPETLADQSDAIETIALRFALEPDDAFVAALKEMKIGMTKDYLNSDQETRAAAGRWVIEFLQAAAIMRADTNISAGITATRTLH
jgi:hypothetical protein